MCPYISELQAERPHMCPHIPELQLERPHMCPYIPELQIASSHPPGVGVLVTTTLSVARVIP
jgi:hypothetical protein